jgi:hypothetical protein
LVLQLVVLIHVIKLNIKNQKNSTLLVVYKSGPIYKILKYQNEWTHSRMFILMVWRRRYKHAIQESVHSSWYFNIFNILYVKISRGGRDTNAPYEKVFTPLDILTFYIWDRFCTPLAMWNFADFFSNQFDNYKLKYQWQQITSLYQIEYMQRIRCIKK